jgi:pilus assembly protein CpaE
MPDDGGSKGGGYGGRHDRALVMAFVGDATDESALRQGLADGLPDGFEIRRGGVRAAITAMEKTATPRILIVDVGGEDQPLAALGALSEVVEPDVQVLVIGEVRDADFYREITRGMGAVEYLAKPLTRDRVARHFGPIVLGRAPQAEVAQGGRIITVTGVRGGVGATTIAVNLAWHFGSISRRHTLLLDANIHTGTVALLLNAQTGPGLRTALEMPDRVDELFVERAAQPVSDRLHVLAAQENLAEYPSFAPDAARHLLDVLRRRYAFVLADVPYAPVSLYRDLLDLSQQRVFVMEPTLASVRDMARMLALPSANAQASRPVIVLNRLGIRGGMNRRQVEDALEMRADLVLPDLPQQIQTAAHLGEPAAAGNNFFKLRIGELAQQVASTRLFDADGSAVTIDRSALQKRFSWNSLFGRSK